MRTGPTTVYFVPLNRKKLEESPRLAGKAPENSCTTKQLPKFACP